MNKLHSRARRLDLRILGGCAVLALGAGTIAASALSTPARGAPAQATPAQGTPARGDSVEGERGGHEAVHDPGQNEDAESSLEAAFGAVGVYVDRASGSVAFPVTTEVRAELLEYVLVNPHGAIHESLFVTGVDASVLGTAFLAVGVEKGKNVEYVAKDPQPTPEQARAGAPTHDTIPPSGKPLFLHVAWRERAGVPDASGAFPDETLHFHRLEDLIVDLKRDRTLRRHGWVWLGSRELPPANDGGPERFAADVTGNLACISFFPQGDTLLTPALPECNSQTSWIANRWLLPAKGAELLLIGASEPLSAVPTAFEDAVPAVAPDVADPPSFADDGGR